MAVRDCRYFNGYKPCGKNAICDQSCPHQDRVTGASILIIHLGAQGAVVRSTSLLPAIKRKYPRSRVTWVTEAPLHHLLTGHPSIDRVFTTSFEHLTELRALHFDVAYVIDKSLKASGVLRQTRAEAVHGFVADPYSGAIEPATSAAEELWRLGLSDELKFHVNKKSENQLLIEALDLGEFQNDEYSLWLSNEEKAVARQRAMEWRRDVARPIIGINTGCGPLMPAKKWTVEFHREIIRALKKSGERNIVLLGGPDDQERNQTIARDLDIVQSPTGKGLRDGTISVAACDVILTGDSLGMHLGIAMKKFVVAWFGPSCAHEIELYGRGVKLMAEVNCGPCWKRVCHKEIMCYDRVPMEKILQAVRQGHQWWSSSHQLQVSPS